MLHNYKAYIYTLLVSISVTIYMLQYYKQNLNVIINNYANDFISIILVLKITQLVIYALFKISFTKYPKYIVFVWIYFSFLFECVIPLYNIRYTSDFFDIAIYLVGTLIFLVIESDDYKEMLKMWKIYK